MKKLPSPEEVKASKLTATRDYLAHAESVMSELLAPLFGSDHIQGTEDLDVVLQHGVRLRKIVMALRRFPRFDIACLSAMKEWEHKPTKTKFYVPSFGVCSYDSLNRIEFHLEQFNSMNVGSQTISFSSTLQGENMETARRFSKSGDFANDPFRLEALAPRIPMDVTKRVEGVRDCFERLSLAWDADWAQRPVADPIVIGEVAGTFFLVDKYDLSKLERYVSSEMTRGPV